MRSAFGLALLISAGGCAAFHAPRPQLPTGTPSHDWRAVGALPRGRFVVVTLDGGSLRQGLVWSTTATTLTVRQHGGEVVLPRAVVRRVTERVQTGWKRAPWYIRVPVAAAVVGGLAGIVAGEVSKHPTLRRGALATFAIGVSAGMSPAARPRPIFADRLVYIRP